MNTKIIGDVNFDANVDYSNVIEITGWLDCRGSDTKASFPALTSVGGWLDCRGSDTKAFKNVKFNDASCPAISICKVSLMSAFLSVGILFADGISSKIISKKQKGDITIYSVVIVGKVEKSFVIERNGSFSHGETVKDAAESLMYKISDRDTSRFEDWDVDTEITLEDAIASYRAITGACESGTKGFCQQQKLKKTYTVKEVIALTTGSYGADKYKEFFA